MTTATRLPARATPLGTGELHCALEAARDLAALNAFCASMGCSPTDVSTDCRQLDLPRVFDLMRARGYDVSQPARAPLQPRPGFTGWLAHIRVPGAEFDIGFYTPNAAHTGKPPKKTRKPSLEHA
jgi:hypothetical protein